MIGWLRRLFGGEGEPDCRHEYETVDSQNYRVVTDSSIYWKTVVQLRCKKCGWVCCRTLKG